MAKVEPINVDPIEAIEHFRRKEYHFGFDWRDTDAATHARSFTVAKVMREDILLDVRQAVAAALKEGQTFRQFYDNLAPTLQKKGWWGKQEVIDPKTNKKVIAQLGSPQRLRIIFDTNLRMAAASGRWERFERTKGMLPYLRYSAVQDSRTRPEHMAWHGIVLPFDHPWWRIYAPPNGWNCRCTLMQLDADDLERYGYKVSSDPPTQTREWLNKRTGKVVQVPVGIDPGFQHNVGLIGQGFQLRDPNRIPELTESVAMHQRIGKARGTNPGGTFRGSDGPERYVKLYDDPAQAYVEVVANRIYRELNLQAPESALIRGADGKIKGIASDLIEHRATLGGLPMRKRRADEVLKGYSADVWLANWDAVGLDLDNIVVTDPRRHKIARIDQGGSLLFRARAGRKPLDRLETLSEWDGFANRNRNPAYARVFDAAELTSADDLGRKALIQIAAIRRLGERTNDFEDLVPKVRGISAEDRNAVLELLRKRAKLLDTEIVPRIKEAMRRAAQAANMPAYEAGFIRDLGSRYREFLQRALATITAEAPRFGLSDPQLTARFAYTTFDRTWGYRPLNSALRSRDPHRVAKFRNYRDTLNSALALLPDYVGTVRRGTSLNAAQMARYRVGEVVTEDAFTSASVGRAAFGGTHRFVIKSRHGKHIQQWSAYYGEREVLFAAGTRFLVLRVEKVGRTTEIWLEELD